MNSRSTLLATPRSTLLAAPHEASGSHCAVPHLVPLLQFFASWKRGLARDADMRAVHLYSHVAFGTPQQLLRTCKSLKRCWQVTQKVCHTRAPLINAINIGLLTCADDLAADGLVNGASAVLGLKAVWRVTCQDPTAAAATAAALVAACRQGSLQVGVCSRDVF